MSFNSGAVKCDNCGAVLRKLPQEETPQGVTFVLEDKQELTLCRSCLIELGSGNFKPKSKKLKSLWKETTQDDKNNK